MSEYNGQKGELLAIEEVGKLLRGKQCSNQAKSDFTDAGTVPVSLKTQGSYGSQGSFLGQAQKFAGSHIPRAKDYLCYWAHVPNVSARRSDTNSDMCSDVFHMTIEEYLHSLISLIEELARLAVNSVTLGDYHRPLAISKFVKDLHAGFQILNLKNDNLRRRSDSIKYNVNTAAI